MKNLFPDQATLSSQLKHLVANLCRPDILEPDGIGDDEPLSGGRLGLDSLDLLELAIGVEETYAVKICNRDASHSAFASIADLMEFIMASARPAAVRPRHAAPPLLARPVQV